MDFTIPEDIQQKRKVLDEFVEREIKPLKAENIQHHRYRITEGSEQIQIRKVAAHLFGFSEERG